MPPFEERFPWIGGDLQTLRDTLSPERLPLDIAETFQIPVSELSSGLSGSGRLLGFLDRPFQKSSLKGVVLMLHGLGGSSRRTGLRRMSLNLSKSGFAVFRLNLRGADPGRQLIPGTYAANCNTDIIPAIHWVRQLRDELALDIIGPKKTVPFFGVGISLGGTILLNACLSEGKGLFDGLVCTSSPLDLAECSESIQRPRNRVYQNWLLRRLVRQTLEDPFLGQSCELMKILNGSKRIKVPKSIREFDELITAPRWGYRDVDEYYQECSPIFGLLSDPTSLPPTLLLQALDDPWVPAISAQELYKKKGNNLNLNFVFLSHGGHNGFHSKNGCWGDKLVKNWINYLVESFR